MGRMESVVLRKMHAGFGGGCDPFSRNLKQFKGMRGKGSSLAFDNWMDVWVRTAVQFPP